MSLLKHFWALKSYLGREPERGLFAWLGIGASVLIVAASAYVLWRITREIDYGKVHAAFTGATAAQLSIAAALTVLSYLLLACYDVIALRHVGVRVPMRTTALASFASYALSFTIGYTLLSAGTVRLWIYSPYGVGPGKVVSLTVIAGFTFTLGMCAVLGWSMVRQADTLGLLLSTNSLSNRLIGLAAAVAVILYLVWIGWKRRILRVRGWSFELPGLRLSAGQLLIGAADVCVAAGVLFMFLPLPPWIGYETCLAVFIFAAMIGSVSNVPGGLGAFEATVLLAFSSLPSEPVLGALLLFRVWYYLVPFLFALVILAIYEALRHMRSANSKPPA